MKRNDKVVNGDLLREMIISGSNNLFNHYPEIDSLNVFPVPDGDTGTNMNLTITSGCKEIENIRNDNVGEVGKIFSRGLLMGARGNSGVILSQIFRGFSQGLTGKETVTIAEFSDAFVNGASVAYKAVMKPVEGTILTVIRESSEEMKKATDENKNLSITDALLVLLNAAKASLQNTPNLLPVLKDVGVVDSGGAGLVRIFEGMYLAMMGENVTRGSVTKDLPKEEQAKSQQKDANKPFIYDIKLILKIVSAVGKKHFDQEKFENTIKGLGENVEISYKEQYVKLSVSTSRPGTCITACQAFGEFIDLSVTSDSSEKLEPSFFEEEAPLQEFAIIATSVGHGLDKLFRDLGVNYVVSGGQTMNPSTEDFIAAIKKVHAKNVVILPNNKNIIMASQQACECDDFKDINAKVVPTKSIIQGLECCMMADQSAPFDQIISQMTDAMHQVKSGQVTFSIKDTIIDGVEIKKDHFMGLSEGKILCCIADKHECVKSLLSKMIGEESSLVTIIYGSDVTEEEANSIVSYIESNYDVEVELHEGDQPVYSYYVGVE